MHFYFEKTTTCLLNALRKSNAGETSFNGFTVSCGKEKDGDGWDQVISIGG